MPEIAANITLQSGAAIVVPPVAVPSKLAIRAGIETLEAAMFAATELQKEIELTHFFAKGLYAREGWLYAGDMATGLIHNQEHLCIISQGRVEILSETLGARIVEAPATFVVPRGTKNCVRAITDTKWTTIHATELTDIDEIKATLTTPHYVDEVAMLENA